MVCRWSSGSVGRRPPHGGADRNRAGCRIAMDGGTSPPARGRGSKQVTVPEGVARCACRPPHGGADRNDHDHAQQCARRVVAPRTGARIETCSVSPPRRPGSSPPARGRGSKRRHRRGSGRLAGRPPHGGADRNDCHGRSKPCKRRSPPARGRGSKQTDTPAYFAHINVAPRTGARIETRRPRPARIAAVCRPPHGGADRNNLGNVYNPAVGGVAPRTGARIETWRTG